MRVRGRFVPSAGTAACFFAVLLLAAGDARAAIDLLGGAGWLAPRGDSAAYLRNGFVAGGGLELEVGSNLGVVLEGDYARIGAKRSRLKSDLGLPADDPLDARTTITGVTLAPRLYLLKHDIAAYVTIGGGLRWLTYRDVAAGTGVSSRREERAWGVIAGFGADIGFPDGFRVGFAPVYRRVAAGHRPLEYASFVFYLKI